MGKIALVKSSAARSDFLSGLDSTLAELFGGEVMSVQLQESLRSQRRQIRMASLLPPDLVPSATPESTEGSAAALVELGVQVDDIEPDLLVLDGESEALSGIGTFAERSIRTLHQDTLVVKDASRFAEEGNILVCIDGSPQSYSGLLKALAIARSTERTVECLAVYDPYIHYTLFNGIVRVLSEQASTVFKFKDQEKLHEEIIDTGLAKIYQAHLEVARKIAEDEEVGIRITLLDGKAYEKIIRHSAKTRPWLTVLGRIGVHSDEDMDIGSNVENVLRACEGNFLICSSAHIPKVDVQAEESVQWTPGALEKMERVPSFVKGVATTAILRWAMERGHSVITPSVINTAMGDLLPPGAAQAMGYVAEEVAKTKDNLEEGKTYVCPQCGYSARDFRPVVCGVCKTEGDKFNLIDREVLQSIGTIDAGHLEDEATFDGKVLRWAREAKAYVRRVPAGYERRRSRARIEKTARVRGLDTITGPFALEVIQQDVAETSYLSDRGERMDVAISEDEKGEDTLAVAREGSLYGWTAAAWARLERVPEGFMRENTQEEVEKVAADRGMKNIDLALCEDGVAESRRLMAEMLANYKSDKANSPTPTN